MSGIKRLATAVVQSKKGGMKELSDALKDKGIQKKYPVKKR